MHRLGLKIGLAILVSLLTLEGGLQLASFVARTLHEGHPLRMAGEDEIVVLCVGDSHTWGAGVEREEAYPAQLEAVLAARHPDLRFRVVNLGVPGVSTAYVAKRLEGQIVELRPDLVIVWAGANNVWNELEVEEADDAAWLHRWLLRSKLYRLVTVLRYTGSSPSAEAERDPQRLARHEVYADWRRRGRPPEVERREQRLLEDMRRMIETTRAFDVPILFVTYPQYPESPISRLIAYHATNLGVDVVVTSDDRLRASDDGFRDEQLFVAAAGPHPTAILYRYIVESMLDPVQALLGLAGP